MYNDKQIEQIAKDNMNEFIKTPEGKALWTHYLKSCLVELLILTFYTLVGGAIAMFCGFATTTTLWIIGIIFFSNLARIPMDIYNRMLSEMIGIISASIAQEMEER